MVGLLKTMEPRMQQDKRRSGCNCLYLKDFRSTGSDLQAHCGMSEVCKQNVRKQDVGLSHNDSDRSKQEQPKDVNLHNFSFAGRPQDVANTMPPKRQRIVSVTRHRFEPFSSKGSLVNRCFGEGLSAPRSSGPNFGIHKQSQRLNRYGNINQTYTELCGDCSSNISHRSCNRCHYLMNGYDSITARRTCSERVNEQGELLSSSKFGSLHSPCNVGMKQAEALGKPLRQHSRPFQTGNNGPKDQSNWNLHRQKNVINVEVCGANPRLVDNGDLEHEPEASMPGTSARNNVNSSFDASCNRTESQNQNVRNFLGNHWKRGELTTLKVFVADESIGNEKLASKQLFMPPSERLKCLKFSPGQYFDVVFEEIPTDELNKLIISEVSGKENQASAGFESLSRKENFVKELKSIFSRLPSLEEESLKERGLFEMILLAKAYFDKYEYEIKEEARRDDQLLEKLRTNKDKSKSSSQTAPSFEQPSLEKKSNASSGNRNEGSCYEFIGFHPITDVEEDGVSSVEIAGETLVDLKSVRSNNSNSVASSALLGGNREDKSSDIRAPHELCNFANENILLDSYSLQCPDVALKNDTKCQKEQQMMAKAAKRRRYLLKQRKSSSNKVRGKLTTSNDHSASVTPTVKSRALVEKEISSSTDTEEYFVSANELTCKRRRCEKGEGAPRETPSQDKIFIADALLSLQECQPTPTAIGEILASRRDAIAEFALVETAKFYKQLLINFMQEKQSSISRMYIDSLRIFKRDKEKELAERMGEILEESKQDIDLRLDCEMKLTNQFFRQELWLRIQKCVCGKVGQLSCCGRCNSTFYCGKRCQVVDFEDHRVVCKEEMLIDMNQI